MAEITIREFDTLKQNVDEIKSDVKEIQRTLNSHVVWEEGYHAEFRGKLDAVVDNVTDNKKKIVLHEERLDKNDIWKAGFTGHIKGMWFAIGTLIPVIFGIILKVLDVL